MPASTVLDVFNSDYFGVVSMTKALDLKPYVPMWLGKQGWFGSEGVTTRVVVIEERHGRISLVPQSAYGTNVTTEEPNLRKAIPFLIPHYAQTNGLLASDIQGVRAFGQENQVETIATKTLEKTSQLRANIEMTKEYQRYGAIQGIVYDHDMSTVIYNYFTAFDVTPQTEVFELSAADTGLIKQSCTNVIRLIHNSLGADMHTGVIGLAGDAWFDAFVSNAEVKAAYNRYQDGAFLRNSQISGPQGYTVGADNMPGFSFGGINFFNSRAKIGATSFIPTDHCRFFPTGVPGLFTEYLAPADYIETVNTVGLPFYAKSMIKDWDKGVEFEVQSNFIELCTRPGVLIDGTKS